MSSILENWEIVRELRVGDLRVKDYFLMQTPLQLIEIIAFYWVFILKLGSKLMENRNPYNVKTLMVAYNIILQIILNTALFLNLIYLLFFIPFGTTLLCIPVVPYGHSQEILIIRAHILFTYLKVLDLSDSIFFVLRKKYSQVTYLHIHHHIFTMVASWITGKYFPGGTPHFVALANTFVHAVMYSYYLVTSWNSKSFKNNLWWKKYITQLQIVQHLFIFTVCLNSMVNPYCTYPKAAMDLYSLNVGLMIYLFCKFYVSLCDKNKNLNKL